MSAMSSSKSTGHILVVEDEQHLAFGIRFNLEADGFRVSTVSDGPSALELFDDPDQDIDLVILDLMLPGMSGYDVCERLREGGHQLPVLMLSARTLAEDRARGFDVGADQYMNKPFELDELLSRVKSLLARFSNAPRESIEKVTKAISEVEIAGIKVDFGTFEVQTGGKKQRLTPLEIKLLKYFVSNEGRVIPRNELLEDVWEMKGSITTRAPDQFIRRLRKLFEPDPSRPVHFLTIRDAGYRFVLDTDAPIDNNKK